MFESIILPNNFIPGTQTMNNIQRETIAYILQKLFGGKVVADTNLRGAEDLFYIQNQDVGRMLIHTGYRSSQTIRNFLIGVCIQYCNVMRYFSRDKKTIRHVYVDYRENYNNCFNIRDIIRG